MSPVEFKKMPCRPVEFKGPGPQGGGQLFHGAYVATPAAWQGEACRSV